MVDVEVVVVGGGPAGIATSACLNPLKVSNIILEREHCCASLLKKRAHDRLKLHLAKQFCELPHMSFPPETPTIVPKNDFIRYLDDYVEKFDVKPHYHRNVESVFSDKSITKWSIDVKNLRLGVYEVYFSTFLVTATGKNSRGYVPEEPGIEGFEGKVMHSSQYDNGRNLRGKNVLVVGSGNSGMKIAYDSSNWNANTSVVVRSPVFPSVTRVEGKNAIFDNGETHHFAAIVFATGYRSTVKNWLKGGDDLFNEKGMPKQKFPDQYWKGKNGLYCAGFSSSGLFGVSMDAENIAQDIISNLTHHKGSL